VDQEFQGVYCTTSQW